MVEPFAIQSRVLSLDREGLRYVVIKDEMLVTSMSSFSHNIFAFEQILFIISSLQHNPDF